MSRANTPRYVSSLDEILRHSRGGGVVHDKFDFVGSQTTGSSSQTNINRSQLSNGSSFDGDKSYPQRSMQSIHFENMLHEKRHAEIILQLKNLFTQIEHTLEKQNELSEMIAKVQAFQIESKEDISKALDELFEKTIAFTSKSRDMSHQMEVVNESSEIPTTSSIEVDDFISIEDYLKRKVTTEEQTQPTNTYSDKIFQSEFSPNISHVEFESSIGWFAENPTTAVASYCKKKRRICNRIAYISE